SDASGKHYFKDGKYFNDQWDIVDNILYIKNSSDAINVNGDCIVVSLYDQKLWLIRNNEILLETGIISGKLSTPTPTGHYSIQNMQSPSTLIGTTYRVYVDYWMPFIGNSYGIHDASWANPDDFSKPSTHYYWGSHGCININPDIMGYIYSNTYIGMDVVIY
ncbi:ErfK/YbiS/YcfS/YnhG, partial [Tissierellia bacterium KA00581]